MSIDYQTNIARLRETIAQIKAQLEELENGFLPKERALARLDSAIEAAASEVSPNVMIFAQTDRNEKLDPIPHGSGGVFDYLCKIVPEAVRAHLAAELETVYADSPVLVDDKKRAKLERELFKAEQDEEKLICEAESQGMRIGRRRGVNPVVLLGL